MVVRATLRESPRDFAGYAGRRRAFPRLRKATALRRHRRSPRRWSGGEMPAPRLLSPRSRGPKKGHSLLPYRLPVPTGSNKSVDSFVRCLETVVPMTHLRTGARPRLGQSSMPREVLPESGPCRHRPPASRCGQHPGSRESSLRSCEIIGRRVIRSRPAVVKSALGR
jgi:hypothetical protein